MDTTSGTRRNLIDLLQLAYSGEKAAALAYRGHARTVKDPAQKAMIERIERDEWVHREKVARLLARLGARPRAFREVRAGLTGHSLAFLCRVSGWFLPMYFAGKLETKNVWEYERAAGWAGELGLTDFIPELSEMAAVEVEHEKYFFEVIGKVAPQRAPAR